MSLLVTGRKLELFWRRSWPLSTWKTRLSLGVFGSCICIWISCFQNRKPAPSPFPRFKVDCILNDTSATLLSFVNTNIYDSSIVDSTNCLISLIFGTGCNIAYYDNSLNRLVCTEVGGYGEKGELDFIKTEIDDLIINERSCHVGEQAFEKFGISDPYLGEAVRLIIVAMIRKEHLFVESSLDRDIQEDPETSVIEQERSLWPGGLALLDSNFKKLLF